MPRRYAHLRFAAHVDWKHISPVLLAKLEEIGAEEDFVIDVFSGYRSNSYSAKHGGFAGDPHSRGIAVDATIQGRPIGNVIAADVFHLHGLRTGAADFTYHGEPDPSHVDLHFGKNPHRYDTQNGSAPMVTASEAGQPTGKPPKVVRGKKIPATGVTRPTAATGSGGTAYTSPQVADIGTTDASPDIGLPGYVNPSPGPQEYVLNPYDAAQAWGQFAQAFPSADAEKFSQLAQMSVAGS